jgi:hypothetical protein
MKDYSEFIEYLLYTENKLFNKVENEYRHQNFFSDDEHYSSIFYGDGYLEIYNGSYPIEGQKRYTIKQVTKLLGHFDKFLAWLCKEYGIPIYKINRIKEIKNNFKLSFNEMKELKLLTKDISDLTGKEFISINDITKTSDISINKIIKNTTFKKKAKSKSEIVILNDEIPQDLQDYFNSRGLIQSDVCFPTIIELKSETYSSKLKAIALKYKDSNFIKYRIFDGFTRYLSYGNYDELYWIRENKADILTIVEGEIEGLCMSYLYDNIDIACLHNSSAFKTNKDLSQYKKIIILLDLDKYESSKKVIEKELVLYNLKNYEILPKYNIEKDENDTKIDINYLYLKDKNNLKITLDSKMKI